MKKFIQATGFCLLTMTASTLLQGCHSTDVQQSVESKSSLVGIHKAGFEQFSISTFSADYVVQRIHSGMKQLAVEHTRLGNLNLVNVTYNNLFDRESFLEDGEFKLSGSGDDIIDAINTLGKDVNGIVIQISGHISPTGVHNHDIRMVDALLEVLAQEIDVAPDRVVFKNKAGLNPSYQPSKEFFNGNNKVEFYIYSSEI